MLGVAVLYRLRCSGCLSYDSWAPGVLLRTRGVVDQAGLLVFVARDARKAPKGGLWLLVFFARAKRGRVSLGLGFYFCWSRWPCLGLAVVFRIYDARDTRWIHALG